MNKSVLTIIIISIAVGFSGFLGGLKIGTKIGYKRAKKDFDSRPFMCGTGQYQLQVIRKKQLEGLPSLKEIFGDD